MRPLRPEGWLVLVVALALPWAYGGVEPWAYRGAGCLLTLAAAVALWRRGWRGLRLDRSALWLAPAAILALWAALQLVPLPPGLLRVLAPGTARAMEHGMPGWPGDSGDPVGALLADARAAVPEAHEAPAAAPLAARQAGPARWRPLSQHPLATAERLAWYLALLLAFVVVRARTATPDGVETWRRALLILAGALAAFGFLQALATPGLIYGRAIEGARPFGPYVNPSHFCGAMELLVPWAAAYAWSSLRRGRSGWNAAAGAIAVALIGAAACLAAASRAGAVLLVGSLAVLVLVASRGRRLIAAGAMVLVLGGLVSTALLWGTLGTRVRDTLLSGGQDIRASTRWAVASSLGQMLGDHPVFGVGFGAFRVVFPRYLASGEAELWNQAHDDWAEVAVEGGVVALLATVWLAAAFWKHAAGTYAAASSRGFRLTRLGLLLGLASLTVHAFVDFNHQIPANALLFVVAAALALSPEQRHGAASGGRSGGLARAAAAVLIALCGWQALRGVPAGLAYARGAREASRGELGAAARSLDRAAVGGLRFEARWLSGQVGLGLWDGQAAGRDGLQRPASSFLDAWATCPTSAWARTGLAEAYMRAATTRRAPLALEELRGRPWDRVGDDGRVALGLARRAIRDEPNVAAHRDTLVRVTLRLGLLEEAARAARGAAAAMPDLRAHDFGAAEPPREVLTAFAEGSRAVLGRTPLMTRGNHLLALGLLEERLGDLPRAEEDLRAAVQEPGFELEQAERRYHFGRILLARRRLQEGEAELVRAAARPEFGPAVASLRAGLAETRGDLRGALEQWRTARRLRPAEAAPCLEFARIARKVNELGLAQEALSWAKVLAPTDPRVHAGFVELALARGDWRAAESALADYGRAGGDPAWADAQRRKIGEIRQP
ncbi:MAG TPA: O-antigen ligase family protein [Candidatus Polarisedimenticolaceae bacterium]|nr:O-antigen ligase family protein [Candidatus Polarisedimenticolaceae bacterium]